MVNCKAYRDGVADACLGLPYNNIYTHEKNISLQAYNAGYLRGQALMGHIVLTTDV